MKINFTASPSPLAQKAFADLSKRYGNADAANADTIVVLGGDGHVLHTLYETMTNHKPVFALRRTESVGFLCNVFNDAAEDLPARIAAAQNVVLHPLSLDAVTSGGKKISASAINEISVLRETSQAVKLRIAVDGIERIAEFSGDGILLATPAGSTAYNHSCGGPIMPLDSNTLVMTAISGYRPRGWSYAVLPQSAAVDIEILETEKRPVRIEAGASVIRDVVSVKMKLDRTKKITLLFDPGEHLGERIIREQFML